MNAVPIGAIITAALVVIGVITQYFGNKNDAQRIIQDGYQRMSARLDVLEGEDRIKGARISDLETKVEQLETEIKVKDGIIAHLTTIIGQYIGMGVLKATPAEVKP